MKHIIYKKKLANVRNEHLLASKERIQEDQVYNLTQTG